MNKKILYVTTVSMTINAFLVPHIKMLISEGNIVDVACNIEKEIDKEIIKSGCKCFNIPFSRNPLSIGNLKAFRMLINIQKENKYDIIHVHTPVAGLYARLLKLKFRELKIIYTAHGYHFYKGAPLLNRVAYYPIEKVMARLTDVIITINKEDYNITLKKLRPKKTCLINGVGIDLNKYKIINDIEKKKIRNLLGLSDEDFIIIMIAELNKNKNHIQIIKVMELLKDKYKNIKVLFVGEGNLESTLKKEVKLRGLSNNILFLGFRKDINELINISDVGAILSYREGLPRSILEFMACGKPVICTDIRGCHDLIIDKYNGFLIKNDDEISIYERIISLNNNEALIDEFKKNTKREIVKYDMNIVLKKLYKLYVEL